MNMQFTEMKIGEMMEQYPEALSVFRTNGFSAETKEDLIEELGPDLMLKTALMVKGIHTSLFENMLEEKLSETRGLLPDRDGKAPKKPNFIGYTYCPLKHIFKECFDETLERYLAETDDYDFTYFVPSGCGGDNPYEDLWKAEHIDELPDIIASAGFGDFFNRQFIERFVSKGYFETVTVEKENDVFVSAGLIDPDRWYTVYSVFPLVMLIDKKKLGSLPIPAKWSDLLNPVYSKNIIIGASRKGMHEDLFLYIHKEFGDQGLKQLAGNIKNGWHASQMAKAAGTNNSEGAAIYVIPWMFAKSCPRTEATEIVWPSDGSIITPTYLLIKKSLKKEYKMFIDFVTGSFYGQKSANNYFPVIHGDVDNKLPEGATFKWLGWDYVKAHPMDALKEYVLKVFMEHWENPQRGEE